MSHAKQITLFTHHTGPNGWKVAFVLQELGLSYELVYLDFTKEEQKAPEFTKYNPNGRIPAIVDHANNDFVLWESDAILLYLVEKYDKEYTISASAPDEKFLQTQWLFFQASGQGPYFGQMAWFLQSHPERLPSAIGRYQKEALRVFSVLEYVLSGREWLTGGKCTIADISFVPWTVGAVKWFLKDYNGFNLMKDFPAVNRWHNAMLARKPIQEVLAIRAAVNPT